MRRLTKTVWVFDLVSVQTVSCAAGTTRRELSLSGLWAYGDGRWLLMPGLVVVHPTGHYTKDIIPRTANHNSLGLPTAVQKLQRTKKDSSGKISNLYNLLCGQPRHD